MEKYSFKKIKNIFVVGGINNGLKRYFNSMKDGLYVKEEDRDKLHPKELERQERKKALIDRNSTVIANATPFNFLDMPSEFDIAIDNIKKSNNVFNKSCFSDSLFIITGDCNIGVNEFEYYDLLFKGLNKILDYNDTFIIFIRGNHDNPEFFDGKTINYSNIKAVPDYSVIEVNDNHILCIGGAISTDRDWRIKHQEIINKFSTHKRSIYWENECPIYNEEALDEITKSVKIDYVVSHSAPSFVINVEKILKTTDKKLLSDIKNERETLDKVFNYLKDKGMTPIYWAFGHFNAPSVNRFSDTIFSSLCDGFNPINIAEQCSSFIALENKRKCKNNITKKKLFSKRIINNYNGIDLEAIGPGRLDEIHEIRENTIAANELELDQAVQTILAATNVNARYTNPNVIYTQAAHAYALEDIPTFGPAITYTTATLRNEQ